MGATIDTLEKITIRGAQAGIVAGAGTLAATAATAASGAASAAGVAGAGAGVAAAAAVLWPFAVVASITYTASSVTEGVYETLKDAQLTPEEKRRKAQEEVKQDDDKRKKQEEIHRQDTVARKAQTRRYETKNIQELTRVKDTPLNETNKYKPLKLGDQYAYHTNNEASKDLDLCLIYEKVYENGRCDRVFASQRSNSQDFDYYIPTDYRVQDCAYLVPVHKTIIGGDYVHVYLDTDIAFISLTFNQNPKYYSWTFAEETKYYLLDNRNPAKIILNEIKQLDVPPNASYRALKWNVSKNIYTYQKEEYKIIDRKLQRINSKR